MNNNFQNFGGQQTHTGTAKRGKIATTSQLPMCRVTVTVTMSTGYIQQIPESDNLSI